MRTYFGQGCNSNTAILHGVLLALAPSPEEEVEGIPHHPLAGSWQQC